MKSLWNDHRFLSSVAPCHWGSPQPTKTYVKAMVRRVFNSTAYKPLRSPRKRFVILKSTP